ncbi:MAG: alpha/beta fold hydrolase, partial [Abditibacteriales bacterium]|nr:alpha/beta fold hydrolase [Abditibacteriales bacterium]MDW8367412.1 alpha/beta fold hydrolase [Abditibacteriales bacterium]
PPFNAPATNPLSWKQNVERRRRRLVEEIFGGFPERRDLSVRSCGTVEREDCTIEKVTFFSDRDVLIPALVLKPKVTPLLVPGVVYLTPFGKQVAAERREVLRLLANGCVVLAMDYRGIGETGTDDNIVARNGFTLGKPIFGERVWDVMRGLDYLTLRQEIDAQRLYVYGEAAAGLIALYAAAVDERVQVACVDRFLISYKPPPRPPFSPPWPGGLGGGAAFAEPISSFLPNVLTLGDVNDIASWAAPRQLLLANGVFADGTRATREEMQRLFARTREAYSLHGREDRLRVTVASSETVWQEFIEACSRR